MFKVPKTGSASKAASTNNRQPLGCLLLFLGVILLCLSAGYWAVQIIRPLQNTAGALQELASIATAPDDPVQMLSSADTQIQIARAGIESAEPFVWPILQLLRPLRNIHPAIADAEPLWGLLDHSTQAAEELLATSRIVLAQDDIRAVLPQVLEQIEPTLFDVTESIATAQTARSQLSSLAWLPAELRPQADQALSLWDSYTPQFEDTLPLLTSGTQHAPNLLGYVKTARYLVLLQVTDELRPSGGLITKFGLIEVSRGVLSDVTILNISDVEGRAAWDWQLDGIRIQPPQPIEQYLGLGNWVLHDANWWLDFRDSAAELNRFWQLMDQAPIDGIIAINEQTLEQWLAVLGDLTLADGSTVGADSLKSFTVSQFYEGERGTWDTQQTIVAQELANAFVERLINLEQADILRLLPVLMQQRDSRDLLMALFDPMLAAWLNELGIDGALQSSAESSTGDYLYIAESNVSYTKSSPLIQQTATYDVWLNDSFHAIRSQLTLTTSNRYDPSRRFVGFPDFYYDGGRWLAASRTYTFTEGYYGGYTRIVRPPSTVLSYASPEVGYVEARTALPVLGTYTGLMRDDSRPISVEWQHTSSTCYTLRLQKQPGAPPIPFTLRLHLADDSPPPTFSIPPLSTHNNVMLWNIMLTTDQQIACQP